MKFDLNQSTTLSYLCDLQYKDQLFTRVVYYLCYPSISKRVKTLSLMADAVVRSTTVVELRPPP
jgi:hypothetical protein